MIQGTVNDGRGLLIRARVSDGGRPYREIELAIATETRVGLALPRHYITELGLAYIGDADWALGGIVIPAMPSYIAYVEWVRGLTPVIAVETPGEPLVGRGLLLGSFLRADFVDGGGAALYSID